MKTKIYAFALAIGAASAVMAVSAEAWAKRAPGPVSADRAVPRASDMPTRRQVHGVTRSRPQPVAPGELENYWQQLQDQGS